MAPMMGLTNSDLVFLLLILAVFLLALWHIRKAMVLVKVLSLLAAFCAACVVFLIVTAGWSAGPSPWSRAQYGDKLDKYELSYRLGEALGRFLFTYIIAALFACWGYSNRRTEVAFPGLTRGIVIALILTAFQFFRTPVGRRVLGV